MNKFNRRFKSNEVSTKNKPFKTIWLLSGFILFLIFSIYPVHSYGNHRLGADNQVEIVGFSYENYRFFGWVHLSGHIIVCRDKETNINRTYSFDGESEGFFGNTLNLKLDGAGTIWNNGNSNLKVTISSSGYSAFMNGHKLIGS